MVKGRGERKGLTLMKLYKKYVKRGIFSWMQVDTRFVSRPDFSDMVPSGSFGQQHTLAGAGLVLVKREQ